MKNLLYTVLFFVVLIVGACEEEPPFINFDPPKTSIDSTWLNPTPATAQEKQILLEDVTGVQCINCPDAATIAKDIAATYISSVTGETRVHVMALHPLNILDQFTKPITKEGHKSAQDFRTKAAADICNNILRIPSSLPKGAIGRRLFAGQTELLIDRTQWAAKASEEITIPAPVNITLSDTFITNNELWVDIKIEYTQTLLDTNYITIAIVEDSIVDVQEYVDYTEPIPSPKYNNYYNHMHILRDAITTSTGDLINRPNAPFVPGRVFLKRYKYTITNPNWVRKNLSIIAFVHNNGNNRTVLQSSSLHLKK